MQMIYLHNVDFNKQVNDYTVSQKSIKSLMKKLQEMHCRH